MYFFSNTPYILYIYHTYVQPTLCYSKYSACFKYHVCNYLTGSIWGSLGMFMHQLWAEKRHDEPALNMG